MILFYQRTLINSINIAQFLGVIMNVKNLLFSFVLFCSSQVFSAEWMYENNFSIEKILDIYKFDQVFLWGDDSVSLANKAVGQGSEVHILSSKEITPRPNSRLGSKNSTMYFPREIKHRSLNIKADFQWLLKNKGGRSFFFIDPKFLISNNQVDFEILNLFSKINDENHVIVMECHANLIEDDVGESLYLLDNIEDFLNTALDEYEVDYAFAGSGNQLKEYLVFTKY